MGQKLNYGLTYSQQLDFSDNFRSFREFNGSLISDRSKTCYILHNQVTRKETNLTDRIFDDYRFNSYLSEFFDNNLLDYLTRLFITFSYQKRVFKYNVLKLRLHLYLAAIQCIQVKHGIFIPNRVYEELEKRFDTKINHSRYNYFYRIFAKNYNDFWSVYKYNKKQDFRNAIQFALTDKEKNGYSTALIREVHNRTVEIANLVMKTRKFFYVKPRTLDHLSRGVVSLAFYEKTGLNSIPYAESKRIKQNILSKRYQINNWIRRK